MLVIFCFAELFMKFFYVKSIHKYLLYTYIYLVQCCALYSKKALSFQIILWLASNNVYKMLFESLTGVPSYYLDGSENVTGLDLSDFPALADRNRREGSGNPTPLINPLAGRAPYGN